MTAPNLPARSTSRSRSGARTRGPATLIVLTVTLLFAAASPAHAKEAKSFIQIVGGSKSTLPLALPEPRAGNGTDTATTSGLWDVIRSDLEHAGYFAIIEPEAYIEDATAGIAPGEFDFDNWRLPGAVGLAKMRCTGSGPNLTVELYVYDVDAGVQMLGRRISGHPDDLRRLAHRTAGAIVEAFTGIPGDFDTRIAAVADFGQGKEIYTFDYDGANPRPVSRNGSLNLAPSWSRDGTRIAYTSYRDNNPDLWITNLRTGRHTKLSGRPGINVGASWAPDDQSLVLTLSKDGDSELYSLDDKGSILSRLTRQWGIDVSPAFSPDGKQIAFASSRNGNPQIFVMDMDGSNVRRLTHLGGHNVSPAFSPDGTQIAFAGRDEGRFDIFIINIDGTGLRRLTQSNADDEDPSFSPSGSHILFSSTRDGHAKQLYVMTTDGNHTSRISTANASLSNPRWGPRIP